MDSQRLKQVSEASNLMPDTILTNWIFSISCLQQHYKSLSNYVKKINSENKTLTDTNSRIDDGYIEEIASLLVTMQAELSELLIDINQPVEIDHQKLIRHTERISKLNQIAQTYHAFLS